MTSPRAHGDTIQANKVELQVLRMSLPSPEAPDGQATLLSEMAPEESHIDLVLRPSRPSQGAIDEDIAQTDLDQTVVAPTEIEANHDAQSTFLPSQVWNAGRLYSVITSC